ncbi:hypothetical protein [Clostridium sp. JN-1]|uniref:hypothetical protein n=1 Tax=Clostridium sp. JN-1 TaxID=2483110 RepID=UPI000F0B10D0|nr:hypothetical protein [Clostridium sp. JN-1]
MTYTILEQEKVKKNKGSKTSGTDRKNIIDICDMNSEKLINYVKFKLSSYKPKSVKGANNLAKILAEKASKRTYNVINEVCSGVIPDSKLETITEMITITAADINKKVKMGKYYPVQQASIPFTDCAMTNGRKSIQSFLKQRNFSELIYR